METHSGETRQGGSWSRTGTGGSTGSSSEAAAGTTGVLGTPGSGMGSTIGGSSEGTPGGATGRTTEGFVGTGTASGTASGTGSASSSGSQYGTQYGQGISDGQSYRSPENLTEHARETASTLADAARTQVTSRISEQKTRAANTLGGVASALHVAGQQIRDQEGSAAAPYVQRAADEIDRLANYLDRAELNEVVHEVESFARRNQALFLGGAFLLGVLGARFLKSSTRPDDYYRSTGYGGSFGYTGAARETTYDRGYTRTLPPTGSSGYTENTQRDPIDTLRSTGQGETSSGYSDRGTL
jgi:hypothetical protein